MSSLITWRNRYERGLKFFILTVTAWIRLLTVEDRALSENKRMISVNSNIIKLKNEYNNLKINWIDYRVCSANSLNITSLCFIEILETAW